MLIYVDRVESKSNIADDPSRMNEFQVLPSLGATFREPVLASLVRKEGSNPELWFGGLEQHARYHDTLLKKFLSRGT